MTQRKRVKTNEAKVGVNEGIYGEALAFLEKDNRYYPRLLP